MTLQEAIEILDDYIKPRRTRQSMDQVDAIKLGIEALREIKWLHESHILHNDELLPGETTED